MAKGSLWAGIAGAANAVGGILQQREADERKQRLYLLEQDILQKRQEALASLRGDIQDKNAASRSDRALDRIQFTHALQSGDISGQFKDPETGNMYGRRKDGTVVPLNITSDDYQDALKRTTEGKADAAALQPDRIRGQMDQTAASTANLKSTTARREATPVADPEGDKIRADYQRQINQRRSDAIKAAKQAAKEGKTGVPFDENQAAQDIVPQLYSVYGGDAVKRAIGGGNNAPPTAPQQQPSAQTNTPSVQDLMAQATAAVKARPDKQAEIEARLQQLMQQYGYQPGQ